MPKVQSRQKRGRPRHFIREWRTFRGLTLEQLAERVGVTHGNLSQLERGLTNYTQPMLEELAYALRCEPADLLMRNPTRDDAVWSVADHLKAASPEKRDEALRIIDALLGPRRGTGTDG